MTTISNDRTEVWQRGPVPGIIALLQPVAHALLQAREEVNEIMTGFPGTNIWERPAGAASVGFHLQHLTGVLDRLFTYAKGALLTEEQLQTLSAEGVFAQLEASTLTDLFNSQVNDALLQLASTDEQTLTLPRGVGRAQIPSTVIGLLFHAAEHTMRHVGQLQVTVKIVKAMAAGNIR